MKSCSSDRTPGPRDALEYKIIFRYAALLLFVVGLLAIGFGASGLWTTATSATLIPLALKSELTVRGLGRAYRGPSPLGPSRELAQLTGSARQRRRIHELTARVGKAA